MHLVAWRGIDTGTIAFGFPNEFSALIEGAVNIASGKAIAVREIVSRIAEQLGEPELVAFGELPTSSEEPPLLVAETTRLNEEVGWSPRYGLDEGLARTIKWWKANL